MHISLQVFYVSIKSYKYIHCKFLFLVELLASLVRIRDFKGLSPLGIVKIK